MQATLYYLDNEKVWTNNYKRIPKDILDIPSLYMMGYAKHRNAWAPLITHYHEYMEFVIVLDGCLRYMIDNQEFTLHGGNMLITYPAEIHGNGDLPQDACEFIWFQIDISAADDFLGIKGNRGEDLYDRLIHTNKRICEINEENIRNIKRAWEGLSSDFADKKLWGYSNLLQFLIQYFCDEAEGVKKSKVTSDIQQSILYMRENIADRIMISDIADSCHLSESGFKSKFKRQLGMSPMSYINLLRVNQAKELLIHTNAGITDIAFRFSFSSSNYFSSVFKKYTGFSPKEFREKIKQ